MATVRFLIPALVLALLALACTSPPTHTPTIEATSETQAENIRLQVQATVVSMPTSTPFPTYTPAPTSTLIPTSSPTPKPTPTLTPLPTATPTPTPLPTFTPTPRPTATPRPIPTPKPVPVSAEARAFAKACGEAFGKDVGATEADFIQWVAGLSVLEAPPELDDFRWAKVGQYLLQINTDVRPMEVIGPNADTQDMYEIEIGIVADMSGAMRRVLVEGGCLGEWDVLLGERMMAAWDRMHEPGFQTPATVEAYVWACVDIRANVPIMDHPDAGLEYMVTWWDHLKPPPGLEDYHAATMDMFLASREAGDVTRVDLDLVKRVNDEAHKVGVEFVALLTSSGCIG